MINLLEIHCDIYHISADLMEYVKNRAILPRDIIFGHTKSLDWPKIGIIRDFFTDEFQYILAHLAELF